METLATALRQARNHDFPAALKTIESRHDLPQRARLTREVARALADQDPSAAATFAMTLPAVRFAAFSSKTAKVTRSKSLASRRSAR